MAPRTAVPPPAAAPAPPGAAARTRLPGNRDAYLAGGVIVVGGGLALWQRHKANKAKAGAANTTATAPTDATYDTSVMDAYNQLEEQIQQEETEDVEPMPTSSGTKKPPPPRPRPTPPPVIHPGPIPGPHPPVPITPPKPTPKPPTPGPAPSPAPKPSPGPRHVTVGRWPAWNGSLFGIAQHEYGNGNEWQKIYAANRSVIGGNPNLIKPGMQLVIP